MGSSWTREGGDVFGFKGTLNSVNSDISQMGGGWWDEGLSGGVFV